MRSRFSLHFTILDRYLSQEFLLPFFLCILGFVIVVLSGQVFWLSDLIIVKKVAAGNVLRLLAYKLPDAIVQSLPFGALFGCLVALARLAKDSELPAIRIGGMSFFRVVLPFLVLGLLISAVTFWLNEWVVPWTNHESQNIIRRIIIEENMPKIEENVFIRGTGDRFFYVRKVDPASMMMQDVMIYETGRALPRIVTAQKAEGQGTKWRLLDGVIHDMGSDGYVAYEAKFNEMTISIDEGIQNLFGDQKTPQEMTLRELRDNIRLFTRSGVNVDPLVVDYYMKMSLPFAGLLLTAAGAPLGVRHPRSGRLFGMLVAGALSFGYFILASVMRSFGANSVLPPVIAAWSPNLIFLVAGIILLFKSERS